MAQRNLYSELPKSGFLRLPQVLHFIPISKASWWNWVSSGKAPAGIKIGRNTTVWRAEDIRKLLVKLSEGSENEETFRQL